MELRVLGVDGPPDDFADNIKTLLSVDEPAWEMLVKWFLTTDSFDVDEAIASPVVAASSLLPSQYRKCAGALEYLLETWHASGLQLSDLQRDLLVWGLSTAEVDRLSALLERLEHAKRRVHTNAMRFGHENAVLPTLEEIYVVCDIRPVFEDYVHPIPERGGLSHTKVLGFSYMVLMELLTEDLEGRTHKMSFQMTEDMLADFQAALQRIGDQLDVLKAKTREFQV